jgi:hypothetical protein
MELRRRLGSPSCEQRWGLHGGHRREVVKLDLVVEGPSHFSGNHNHPHSTMWEPILPTVKWPALATRSTKGSGATIGVITWVLRATGYSPKSMIQ